MNKYNSKKLLYNKAICSYKYNYKYFLIHKQLNKNLSCFI